MKHCQRSWQWKALYTIAPFSRRLIVIGPFISQKNVSMTIFTDRCTPDFFFNGKSGVFPLNELNFPLSLVVENPGLVIYKQFFFTKICFSLLITHFPVNFTLLGTSQPQKDLMTNLCPSVELTTWYAASLNSLKISLRD